MRLYAKHSIVLRQLLYSTSQLKRIICDPSWTFLLLDNRGLKKSTRKFNSWTFTCVTKETTVTVWKCIDYFCITYQNSFISPSITWCKFTCARYIVGIEGLKSCIAYLSPDALLCNVSLQQAWLSLLGIAIVKDFCQCVREREKERQREGGETEIERGRKGEVTEREKGGRSSHRNTTLYIMCTCIIICVHQFRYVTEIHRS